jgi:hypothetical protein
MVTYFNRKDLVSFGNYLLSDERKERFKINPNFRNGELLKERLSQVHHADVENWMDDSKTQPIVNHGSDCFKILHDRGNGYLHDENDDSPYMVDGVKYCGRCHSAI